MTKKSVVDLKTEIAALASTPESITPAKLRQMLEDLVDSYPAVGFDPWKTNTPYATGDVVMQDNTAYTALTAVPASPMFMIVPPPGLPSPPGTVYWKPLGASTVQKNPPVAPTGDTTPPTGGNAGDIVVGEWNVWVKTPGRQWKKLLLT